MISFAVVTAILAAASVASYVFYNDRETEEHPGSSTVGGANPRQTKPRFGSPPRNSKYEARVCGHSWVATSKPVSLKHPQGTASLIYYREMPEIKPTPNPEASLIIGTYVVEPAEPSYTDSSLFRNLNYKSLSPECRGAYLTWLVNGRREPAVATEYITLFLWGLERRIVVESALTGRVSDKEFQEIGLELKSLAVNYSDRAFFSERCYRLLEWMKHLRPALIQINFDIVRKHQLALLFSRMVGQRINRHEPIPAAAAWSWLWFTGYPETRSMKRCPVDFEALFIARYREQHGKGMRARPGNQCIVPSYVPLNPGLSEVHQRALPIPDPLAITDVTEKLHALADHCDRDLDQYARYLGRKNTSPNDLQGLLLLPRPFAERLQSRLANFTSWVNSTLGGEFCSVTFRDLWHRLSDTELKSADAMSIGLLQGTLDFLGIGFAPDPRYHNGRPSLDRPVLLYLRPTGGSVPAPHKPEPSIEVALSLSAKLVGQGKAFSADRLRILDQFIDALPDLQMADRYSLRAYTRWRVENGVAPSQAKKWGQGIHAEDSQAIRSVLIHTASAGGAAGPDQIHVLQRLYAFLGLEPSAVTIDLHDRAATGSVRRSAADARQQSSAIFVLDAEKLAAHEAETTDVQGMLSTIFADTDSTTTETDDEHESGGLDPAHHKLYQRLISNETWERDAIEPYCESLGLMLDGALETINDWAFEVAGDALIDNDETITIHADVVDYLAST